MRVEDKFTQALGGCRCNNCNYLGGRIIKISTNYVVTKEERARRKELTRILKALYKQASRR